MEKVTTSLVLIIFISEILMDQVYAAEKILCWKKIKEGKSKMLALDEYDEYILPAYEDERTCCKNGGKATTPNVFPWEKRNELSREPIPCRKVKKCADNEESCLCERSCVGKPIDEVCGSNGQTYRNKCEMLDAACKQKKPIRISYQGKCKAKCENVKCSKGHSCVFDQTGTSYCIERSCECTPDGSGKVCGEDNKTYDSKCHLRREECRSHQVIKIKYYETCDETKTCKDIKCKQNEACVTTDNGQPRCMKCCQKKSTASFKVCGSNGKLYKNVCALRSDACSTGKSITMDFGLDIKKNCKKTVEKPS